MDNASKALILAGGILIGMLIIALSMYMYRSFQDAYEASMKVHSSYEINAFNTYFTRYGKQIKGSDVHNIVSRAYEINKDNDAIIDHIALSLHDGIRNLHECGLNQYYRYFYYTDIYEEDYEYTYGYNDEGIVNSVMITRISS